MHAICAVFHSTAAKFCGGSRADESLTVNFRTDAADGPTSGLFVHQGGVWA
jgi:hypothetical protein